MHRHAQPANLYLPTLRASPSYTNIQGCSTLQGLNLVYGDFPEPPPTAAVLEWEVSGRRPSPVHRLLTTWLPPLEKNVPQLISDSSPTSSLPVIKRPPHHINLNADKVATAYHTPDWVLKHWKT